MNWIPQSGTGSSASDIATFITRGFAYKQYKKADAIIEFDSSGSNGGGGIRSVFNFHQATDTINARYVAVQELLSPTHDIAPG